MSGAELTTHLENFANKLDTLGKSLGMPGYVHGDSVRSRINEGAHLYKGELVAIVNRIDERIEKARLVEAR